MNVRACSYRSTVAFSASKRAHQGSESRARRPIEGASLRAERENEGEERERVGKTNLDLGFCEERGGSRPPQELVELLHHDLLHLPALERPQHVPGVRLQVWVQEWRNTENKCEEKDSAMNERMRACVQENMRVENRRANAKENREFAQQRPGALVTPLRIQKCWVGAIVDLRGECNRARIILRTHVRYPSTREHPRGKRMASDPANLHKHTLTESERNEEVHIRCISMRTRSS